MKKRILLFAALIITFTATSFAAAPKKPAAKAKAPAPQKHTVTRDSKSFMVDGKRVFIFSGAIHYFRVPEELWADRLNMMKAAGLNTVETYVAWNKIEPVEGESDFSELDRFLTLADKMGFYVIARPGPYICAEWEAGGYPTWVIAKGAKLRTPDPLHLSLVKKYYEGVLPVIKKHLITNGGRVILVQVENEYNYTGKITEEEQTEYIRFLYKLTQAQKIDVPIFTCWTHVVRKRDDPDMKNMTDSCNFYPRGNWPSVEKELVKLRAEQPDGPLMVTELEGGWFSNYSTPLSLDQPGVDAKEINALTKLVIANGVTALNYYMYHGGTNFGHWPAKFLTTTYDYYAPLGEGGWLYDKYFETRLLGQFLSTFGPALAGGTGDLGDSKFELAEGDPNSVHIFARKTDRGYFLFVQNITDDVQKARIVFSLFKFIDGNQIDAFVTNSGALTLQPRAFLILPFLVKPSSNDFGILSSTAEILLNETGKIRYLTVYGNPDDNFELRMGLDTVPKNIPKQYESAIDKSAPNAVLFTIKGKFTSDDMLIPLSDTLRLLVVTRDRAARMNWTADGPLVSDAFVYSAPGPNSKLTLLAKPGKNEFSFPAHFSWGKTSPKLIEGSMLARSVIDVPVPQQSWEYPVKLEFKSRLDLMFDNKAYILPDIYTPLEKAGWLSPGFYSYFGKFSSTGGSLKITLEPYSDDPIEILIDNTKQRMKHKKPEPYINSRYYSTKVTPGEHDILLLYENPGRANGGDAMSESKGIKKFKYSGDGIKFDKQWSVAPKLFGEMFGWQNEQFSNIDGEWVSGPADDYLNEIDWLYDPDLNWYSDDQGVVWYRAKFNLKKHDGWFAPLRLHIVADGFAYIYVNNRLMGKYLDSGPQSDFYLPDPWLNFGDGENTISIALQARGDKPGKLKEAFIAPYWQHVMQIIK
ncbi:MAG: beta-galactosidase [bacterium]